MIPPKVSSCGLWQLIGVDNVEVYLPGCSSMRKVAVCTQPGRKLQLSGYCTVLPLADVTLRLIPMSPVVAGQLTTVDRPVPDCGVSLYSLVRQSQPRRRPKQDIRDAAVSSECVANHPQGYNGEGDDREDSHLPHWSCCWRRLSLAKNGVFGEAS